MKKNKVLFLLFHYSISLMAMWPKKVSDDKILPLVCATQCACAADIFQKSIKASSCNNCSEKLVASCKKRANVINLLVHTHGRYAGDVGNHILAEPKGGFDSKADETLNGLEAEVDLGHSGQVQTITIPYWLYYQLSRAEH